MESVYRLRRVELGDKLLLYQWVTDKVVRANSFQTGDISIPEHSVWFESHLSSKQCDMFILEYREKPVGQIRIDWESGCGQIDYSIASDYRGQGHGTVLLRMIESEISGKLLAKVKADNVVSNLIFEHAGYTKKIEKDYILYTKYVEK